MKARPILFSGPMVRALREGRKTQTRRPVTSLRGNGKIRQFEVTDTAGYDFHFRDRHDLWNDVSQSYVVTRCPYGQAGDLLWVREAWRFADFTHDDYGWMASIQYRADGHLGPRTFPPRGADERLGWRPSIHMPREASRLTLRLTDVRVERLEEISYEDAVSEGVEGAEIYGDRYWRDYSLTDAEAQCSPSFEDPRASFRTLWDSINAARGFGWDANPWVWALSFEVIHADVDRVLATLGDAA